MSSSAARLKQQAYRDRVASGRAVLMVEVNVVEVTEMLLGAGMLADWTDDPKAIGHALGEQVRSLVNLHNLSTRYR